MKVLRAYLEPVIVGMPVRHKAVDAITQMGLLSKMPHGHRLGVVPASADVFHGECFGVVDEVDALGYPGCCWVVVAGDVSGYSSLTLGEVYFLGVNPGTITLAAPQLDNQIIQEIGVAISPEILFVNSSKPMLIV